MIGRVYVNEIAPQAVVLDFSVWPSNILNRKKSYGFAYLKTLEQLGIRTEVLPTGCTALLEGNTADVKQQLPRLQMHIGLIARYGASLEDSWQKDTQEDLSRILGELTQHTLRDIPADTPFSETGSAITMPFADAANDPKELFYMVQGGKPWWYEPSPHYQSGHEASRQTEWDLRAEHIASFLVATSAGGVE